MSGAHLPCVLRATAPFVYVRLHGPDRDHLYAGSYSGANLGWWTELREWGGASKVSLSSTVAGVYRFLHR